MKQYGKRVLLALCMIASLFLLTACTGKKAAEQSTLDPQQSIYISQITEGLLEEIVSLDKTAAEQSEASPLDMGEDGLASGVASWLGAMKDTGAFLGIISSDTKLNEDKEYVATVVAEFEKRNAEIKVFYTMDLKTRNLNPVSISISPEYTTPEKLAKAAMNTVLGMGTVFIVLIFISLLIGCFKFIHVFEQKLKAKDATHVPVKADAAPAADTVDEELTDDLELVAVITAAIAAATGSSSDGLVVRSVRRAPGAKWKRA